MKKSSCKLFCILNNYEEIDFEHELITKNFYLEFQQIISQRKSVINKVKYPLKLLPIKSKY